MEGLQCILHSLGFFSDLRTSKSEDRLWPIVKNPIVGHLTKVATVEVKVCHWAHITNECSAAGTSRHIRYIIGPGNSGEVRYIMGSGFLHPRKA